MAYLPGEPSHRSGNSSSDKETADKSVGKWFFSRKEIEENSPSRADGIDLRKETYLRKSYCTFLQDFGMRLKIPQVTIATAIVFCHRFFLRQSHAKNDRRIIATVCLFLAGKVEETPRLLKDIIIVSYEIIHKKDPSATQKIKQKDVYEQQKELILLGERIVLTTLGFDLNVYHPYKPLVEAIKRFKVAQNALAQVAWNFVNDGLRTSLCLQYKPHLIAAGAIFLAAKFLKVKLPSDGEVIWWQEFDVTPRQLEDVSNQMLELYEQNRAGQSSLTNEVEGSIGGNNQPAIMASAVGQSSISGNGHSSDVGMSRIKQEPVPACPSGSLPQNAQKNSDGNGSSDNKKGFWDCNVDGKNVHSINEVEKNSGHRGNATETSKSVISNKLGNPMEAEWQDHGHAISLGPGNQVSSPDDAVKEFSFPDAIKKIDKNKFIAASEKRQRLHNDVAKKNDIVGDDDLIKRELENGLELPIDEEISKQVRYRDSSSPLSKQEPRSCSFDQEGSKDAKNARLAGQRPLVGSAKSRACNVEHGQEEEGELSSLDEQEFPSPKYHSKAVNSKQLTGLCGNGRPDGLKRNRDNYECAKLVNERVMGSRRHSEGWQRHDDYECAKLDGLKRNRDDYECAKPVNERVKGSRRHPEGWQQHDDSQFPREASVTAGLGNPGRDHKKHRYATHG